MKGPKYRLPTKIDFKACAMDISSSVNNFCSKWCKRENVSTNALSKWKEMVSKIIEQRINFYRNNPEHLPKSPIITAYKIKHIIKKFHSQYVLVPADKAANNIIIV